MKNIYLSIAILIKAIVSKKGLFCNPGQNIWNKIEKFIKTGQEKKNLISTFAFYCQSLISGRKTG